MENLKDKVSTICGVIFAVCTSIVATAASGVIVLPTWLTATAGTLIAVSGGIIGILTGKNPNGSTKTTEQVVTQNTQAKQ